MSQPTKSSIMLANGRYWDPYAETLDHTAIELGVLSLGLARTARFKGQTTRLLLVDEHSIRVARFAERICWRRGMVLDPMVTFWGLNHDSHEPLTPWGDCPTPLKTPEMRVTEARIDCAILLALGVEAPSPEVRSIVKQADMIALYFEALLWAPNARDWAPDLLRMTAAMIEDFLPLVEVRGETWRAQVEAILPACSRNVGVGGSVEPA